jgi:hypothetical protein
MLSKVGQANAETHVPGTWNLGGCCATRASSGAASLRSLTHQLPTLLTILASSSPPHACLYHPEPQSSLTFSTVFGLSAQSKCLHGTFAQGCGKSCGAARARIHRLSLIGPSLTISKLKRWSINYYIDTATTAGRMTAALQRATAAWASTTPSTKTRARYGYWPRILAQRAMVGLSDAQRSEAEPTLRRWRGGWTAGSRRTV